MEVETSGYAPSGRAGKEVPPSGQSMLDRALEYVGAWNDVIPLNGKTPRTMNGLKDGTPDKQQVRKWWGMWPEADIGLVLPNGVVVFDIDPRNGGTLESLGEIPQTVIARTGGGGWHVWFSVPSGTALKGKCDLLGVDIRKRGNYVVAPPSLHASGQRYTWESGCSLLERSPAPIPGHLLKLITAPIRSAPPSAVPPVAPSRAMFWVDKAVERAAPGNRNQTGFWLATQLRDNGILEDEAEEAMRAYAEAVGGSGDHPYTEEEALASLRQAYAREPREPAQREGEARIGPEAGEERGGTLDSGAQGASMRDGVGRQQRSQSEAAGSSFIHSFIHSPKTDFKGAGEAGDEDDLLLLSYADPTRRELMRRMRLVDEMPNDGVVQHVGSNAQKRRRKHYEVLRAAWSYLFPGDTLLSLNEMSTWLKRVEEGQEGEMVLDQMFCFADAPRKQELRSPRAAFDTALLNATHPEKARQLRQAKQEERTAYKQEKRKQVQPKQEPSTDEAARWTAAKAACKGSIAFNPNWSLEEAEKWAAWARRRGEDARKTAEREAQEQAAREVKAHERAQFRRDMAAESINVDDDDCPF